MPSIPELRIKLILREQTSQEEAAFRSIADAFIRGFVRDRMQLVLSELSVAASGEEQGRQNVLPEQEPAGTCARVEDHG
jgi:hypothetical protein